MNSCILATESINSLRSLLDYRPGQQIEAQIKFFGPIFGAKFEEWKPYVSRMTKAAVLATGDLNERTPGGMVTKVETFGEVAVMAPEGFDFDRARLAIRKKLDEVTGHLNQHQARLNNPDFVAKAAPEMQEHMRQRAQELAGQEQFLRDQLWLLEEAD
jgi:valyl-tRNA synthetase